MIPAGPAARGPENMHGLNPILGKGSHLRVLRVLHRSEAPLTGREVQRRAGLSNRATMLALEALTDLCVVQRETGASQYGFRINTGHFLWRKAVRPALEAEEEFWEDLRKLVRRVVKPRPEAAMVTGPLARHDDAETGPVELHLLFERGRQRLQAYRHLDRLRAQVEQRYGLEIDVTFMDLSTMDQPEYRKLWDTIAGEGVLLFGKLP